MTFTKSIFLLLLFVVPSVTFSDDVPSISPSTSSEELVRLAWKSSNENKPDQLNSIYDLAQSAYGAKADVLASQLNAFPSRDRIKEYSVMNDVAVVMFVRAENLMHAGNNAEAIDLFNKVIERFPWSQAFDPSRGGYWSVKEKAEASIKVITGKAHSETVSEKIQKPSTQPDLAFPGTEKVVDYLKYGEFLNPGTENYHYRSTDQPGLVAAQGEAIYPNLMDLFKDPAYKKAVREGRLQGSHWDFVNTTDLQAAIFKWATAPEPWGVRLFYMGVIFEKAKMYYEAIKCYRAITVHFPNTLAWTYWQTPWYPAQAAISKIKHIIRTHPELKLYYQGAKIRIQNAFDNDPKNDITSTNPGILKELTNDEIARGYDKQALMALGNPIKTLGKGKVRLVKYSNGHWQLLVQGKPYMIKGVTYTPAKVGQSPDKGTLENWMLADSNKNGLIDGPDEAFMDKNRNNVQDVDEPTVGDFALMKEMGVNTLRIYHQPNQPNKELLRRLYKDHGIMVIMGDFLGKYALGSGATWSEGTDYENPVHQKEMLKSVRQIVMEYKNEPYILMWLLGNENNYGVASNADKKPDAYYKFVNQVAKAIKTIDPNHPVALCNGDTLFLDKVGQWAPNIDAYAANVYRGDYGFGSFWEQVSEALDRPSFISEYGAPAFAGNIMSQDEAESAQSDYHHGNWMDILENSAGYSDGIGNSIGGVAFEWVDEWWKNYEPSLHDTKADVVGPFAGGYYYEEWFGLLGQGDGKKSPLLREPRKVYYNYKELWNS